MRRCENEGRRDRSYNDDAPTQPTRCWRPQKKSCPPLSSTHLFRLCLDLRHVSSRHTAQTGINHDMTGRGSEGGCERKPHIDWTRIPKAETMSMHCGHHISTRICMGTKLARQLRQRSAGESRDWSGPNRGVVQELRCDDIISTLEVAFWHIYGQGPMGRCHVRLLGLFGALGGATWSYEALGVGPVCLLTTLS